MWIVCLGDIGAGFNYVGPFNEEGEAQTWAGIRYLSTRWCVVRLSTPTQHDTHLAAYRAQRQRERANESKIGREEVSH
jgi:hypothetical protein